MGDESLPYKEGDFGHWTVGDMLRCEDMLRNHNDMAKVLAAARTLFDSCKQVLRTASRSGLQAANDSIDDIDKWMESGTYWGWESLVAALERYRANNARLKDEMEPLYNCKERMFDWKDRSRRNFRIIKQITKVVNLKGAIRLHDLQGIITTGGEKAHVQDEEATR